MNTSNIQIPILCKYFFILLSIYYNFYSSFLFLKVNKNIQSVYVLGIFLLSDQKCYQTN